MLRSRSTDLCEALTSTAITAKKTMLDADGLSGTGQQSTLPGTNEKSVPTRPEGLKTGVSLSQLVPANPRAFRRIIRRTELRQIVPLADTTIYDMERRGEFPRRFNLTSRCVVWDQAEVEAWVEARRQATNTALLKRAPTPDVRRRKRRPVKVAPASDQPAS